MTKRALITGITGQDGSYLADLLLEKGYEVHGMVRARGEHPPDRPPVRDEVVLHTGDLLDEGSLTRVLSECLPDEVYNLAGTSFVAASWSDPVRAAESTAAAVARLLESVRRVVPEARFYQASSSEIFGLASSAPQDEDTPVRPRTPYGAAKAYGHFLTVTYRESRDLFATSGILYNHESPRRGLEFVTRKVTHGAAAIKLDLASELALGNLDAERDWGYAKDYVLAMWLMLQQDEPEDYVVATGVAHSVRELVNCAFGCAGLDPERYVRRDERFVRPAELVNLVGDASKARERLGWQPSVSFDELVQLMVDADLALLASSDAAASQPA
jgi:GDPmannose 4,6-dehydratase